MFGLALTADEAANPLVLDRPGRLDGQSVRLPPPADAFDSAAWFEILAETCLAPGTALRIDTVSDAAGPLLTLPMAQSGTALRAIATFYTCRLGPPHRPGADLAEAAALWARDLRRRRDRPTRLWFEALDDPKPLRAGLRRAGWLTEVWPQFGNWYLATAGLGFADYWAQRPPQLRNTVERKARALTRQGLQATFETYADPEQAVAVYDRVHALSWKEPEPHPAFMPTLIRRGLPAGWLRVGAMLIDGEPAAAQVWVVARRRATIFKLAYAEPLKSWSPGSQLTRHMMRALLDAGAVDEIDFGCGDDPYKRDWLPDRRQRWGLAAYDPRTASGLAAAARNLLPRLWRRPGRP